MRNAVDLGQRQVSLIEADRILAKVKPPSLRNN
jgi:hypothetical protein